MTSSCRSARPGTRSAQFLILKINSISLALLQGSWAIQFSADRVLKWPIEYEEEKHLWSACLQWFGLFGNEHYRYLFCWTQKFWTETNGRKFHSLWESLLRGPGDRYWMSLSPKKEMRNTTWFRAGENSGELRIWIGAWVGTQFTVIPGNFSCQDSTGGQTKLVAI